MRVPGVGRPRDVIEAACAALRQEGMRAVAVSQTFETAPLGPSRRRYANAAAIVASALEPPALLVVLQNIEAAFGRRRMGLRWRSRPLDLDVVLWSGGAWSGDGLIIPHPDFRARDFVLLPAAAIARDWRDPLTGLTLGQLRSRLTRPGRVPSERPWSGP